MIDKSEDAVTDISVGTKKDISAQDGLAHIRKAKLEFALATDMYLDGSYFGAWNVFSHPSDTKDGDFKLVSTFRSAFMAIDNLLPAFVGRGGTDVELLGIETDAFVMFINERAKRLKTVASYEIEMHLGTALAEPREIDEFAFNFRKTHSSPFWLDEAIAECLVQKEKLVHLGLITKPK